MNHFFWSGCKPVTAMAGLVAALAVAMAAAFWPSPGPEHPPEPGAKSRVRPVGMGLVSREDTIDGAPILDPAIVARIERVAASLPAELLAGHQAAAQVRFIASATGSDDDGAISHGVFREPAAALAFGCALDDHLGPGCPLVEPAAEHATAQAFPGLRCTPMRLALGAPVYEPDRCIPDG